VVERTAATFPLIETIPYRHELRHGSAHRVAQERLVGSGVEQIGERGVQFREQVRLRFRGRLLWHEHRTGRPLRQRYGRRRQPRAGQRCRVRSLLPYVPSSLLMDGEMAREDGKTVRSFAHRFHEAAERELDTEVALHEAVERDGIHAACRCLLQQTRRVLDRL
jgi:hypothetical protein